MKNSITNLVLPIGILAFESEVIERVMLVYEHLVLEHGGAS